MDCTRKHTLVTGCSSGIGRATALRLAAAGQHVYAGVRNPADGDQLARSAAGGELTPLILDVTDSSHIAAAAAVVSGHAVAGLDGLVNNAGFGLACPTELVQLEAFRRQLEVNVTGQLAVTQAMPAVAAARTRPHRDGQHDRGPLHPAVRRPAGCDQGRARRTRGRLRQELAPWGVRVVLIEPASINSGAADKVSRDATAAMAAAGPQGRALYEETFTKMLDVMQRREANGSPPDVAAATITRALTATRSRNVYLTGKNSRRLAILSKLPTPILDAARRRIFRLPFPGPSPPSRGHRPGAESASFLCRGQARTVAVPAIPSARHPQYSRDSSQSDACGSGSNIGRGRRQGSGPRTRTCCTRLTAGCYQPRLLSGSSGSGCLPGATYSPAEPAASAGLMF